MGNEDIGAAFNNLAQQITGLSSTIKSQGIAQMIPPFNGVPSKFKKWIKNIEKYVFLNDVGPGRIKWIAFQNNTDCVSDFLQRYLGMNENIT
jgi:hypothetical protein